jgi:hypothetical protein
MPYWAWMILTCVVASIFAASAPEFLDVGIGWIAGCVYGELYDRWTRRNYSRR